MSRIKVALLSLLAAFALSAVASTTALAGTSHVYLIEQTELGAGSNPATEAIEGKSTSSKVEIEAAGNFLVTLCKSDEIKGELKTKGASDFNILFSNCELYDRSFKTGEQEFLTACKVKEPVEASGVGELITHSITEFKEFKGALVLEGTLCGFVGKFEITGTQTCSTPEGGFSREIHNLECAPAASSLKLQASPAQFFGTQEIKLKSKKKWAAT
jgi:hypothetical protein